MTMLRAGRFLTGSFTLAILLLLRAPVASAQVDLTGNWSGSIDQERQAMVEGPNYVDYMGIPLNAQARAAALSHTPENISLIQRQCQPYSLHYLVQAGFGFRMWATVDPQTGAVIAWNMTGSIDREPTTIWMDGRERPSTEALATPAGFTTGSWQGDTLVTTTTHLQDGYLTRNGVPASEQEVLTMFFTRQGSMLLITAVIRDPVNLTAPYVLTSVYRTNVTQGLETAVGLTNPNACAPSEELPHVLNGNVPTYLAPADNPNLMEMTNVYNIPHEAALGGERTMYPEYARQIAPSYQPPKNSCTRNC